MGSTFRLVLRHLQRWVAAGRLEYTPQQVAYTNLFVGHIRWQERPFFVSQKGSPANTMVRLWSEPKFEWGDEVPYEWGRKVF
jgi:hypothetical protein